MYNNKLNTNNRFIAIPYHTLNTTNNITNTPSITSEQHNECVSLHHSFHNHNTVSSQFNGMAACAQG